MKPQDLIFLILLEGLIISRKNNWLIAAGLISIVIAMPLFAFHIFFNAQHLTYYAAGFFLVAIIFKFGELRKQ